MAVTPDPEHEAAFRTLLARESEKENSNVQRLERGDSVASQAVALARTQYDRAMRELAPAIEVGDFDEPYLNVYRSLISGCKALLAGYGYRVRGGDGAHFETFRLAALGLAIWDSEAGSRLERAREPLRRTRIEAEYQRPGVASRQDLKDVFDVGATVLPALVRACEILINAERLMPDEWPVARFDE